MKKSHVKAIKPIRILRILLLCLSAVIILAVTVFLCVFGSSLRTLSTFRKLDDYGMCTMNYYADYRFDEYLETGADSPRETEKLISRLLLHGIPIDLNLMGEGCSTFFAQNEKGEYIYGRSFDFGYSPSVVVFTNPDNGYASVGVADLSFAGYKTQSSIPKKNGLSIDSLAMMSAPYLCMDGMNEKGVAIAVMTVPIAEPPHIEGAPTLNTCTMIRLVLDKAASVDEAVELMRQYNIFWYGSSTGHFLIADASGRSVVVEYHDETLNVLEVDTPYQIATNFNLYDDRKLGDGVGRYDTIEQTITENDGTLTREQALSLLEEVVVSGRAQWSSLYNLTTGEVSVFPNGRSKGVRDFSLEMTHGRQAE